MYPDTPKVESCGSSNCKLNFLLYKTINFSKQLCSGTNRYLSVTFTCNRRRIEDEEKRFRVAQT